MDENAEQIQVSTKEKGESPPNLQIKIRCKVYRMKTSLRRFGRHKKTHDNHVSVVFIKQVKASTPSHPYGQPNAKNHPS